MMVFLYISRTEIRNKKNAKGYPRPGVAKIKTVKVWIIAIFWKNMLEQNQAISQKPDLSQENELYFLIQYAKQVLNQLENI